jgi:hypothetical protein
LAALFILTITLALRGIQDIREIAPTIAFASAAYWIK